MFCEIDFQGSEQFLEQVTLKMHPPAAADPGRSSRGTLVSPRANEGPGGGVGDQTLC